MSYTFPNAIHSNELESNDIELCVIGSNARNSHSTALHVQIHEKAVKISNRYKKDEVELIEVLDQVENHKVYLHYKCSSLHQYGVQELKLSENVVYSLIGIMRKSREVPELKLELQQGNLNLSNARRIVPLLTSENKNEWIKKASTLSQLKLEKEIVKVRPRLATPERAKYINHNRIKLELGLFEEDMMKLRRAQDFVSQSKGEGVNLEDTLIAMLDFYLHHKDPVVKAKRVYVKKGFSSNARTQGLEKGKLSAKPMTTEKLKAKPKLIAAQEPDEGVSTTTSEAQAKKLVNPGQELVLIPNQEKPAARFVINRVPNQSLSKNLNKNAPTIKPATHQFINQPLILKRTPIPARILHQINLRDERKCTYPNAEGKPCNQTRWTQIHHITPVSEGGKNTLENLTTLCSTHHRWVHEEELRNLEN